MHFFANTQEGEILQHTIQLCGMTKALGDRYAGALVNAVQPLVVCKCHPPKHTIEILMAEFAGGQSLKEPEQQAELTRMLQRIEQVTTLSTTQGVRSLQEAWSAHVQP